VWRVREKQGLCVGVHGDELDTHELGADHAIHRIASTTADPDDLDEREIFDVRP